MNHAMLAMCTAFLLTGCGTDEANKMNTPNDRSRSQLKAIEDDVEFVGTVIDDIWALPWPEDNRSEEYVAFFRSLPPEKRVIWATWRLQGEVQNGGFGQYLANLEHNYFLDEARNGLAILEAHEMLLILDAVLQYEKEHESQIKEARDWSQYVEIMGVVPLDIALNKVSSRFFSKIPEFYAVRRKYILEHIEVFAPAP